MVSLGQRFTANYQVTQNRNRSFASDSTNMQNCLKTCSARQLTRQARIIETSHVILTIAFLRCPPAWQRYMSSRHALQDDKQHNHIGQVDTEATDDGANTSRNQLPVRRKAAGVSAGRPSVLKTLHEKKVAVRADRPMYLCGRAKTLGLLRYLWSLVGASVSTEKTLSLSTKTEQRPWAGGTAFRFQNTFGKRRESTVSRHGYRSLVTEPARRLVVYFWDIAHQQTICQVPG